MIRPIVATSFAVLLPAALLPACMSGAKGDGLVEVNQLVGSIERIHTCTELAQERVHVAMRELQTLMVFDFKGDAVQAYSAFAVAVEESTKQVVDLRAAVEATKEFSEPVFSRWAKDLEEFKSMEMRLRSQSRLKETRERYDAVVQAAELAQVAYDALNEKFCDYSVYLANDFNAASVSAVQGDVRSLTKVVEGLDARFDTCQEAARVYIDAAALPMTMAPASDAPPKSAPKGATKRAPRKDG